jgi:hypothetical protein
MGAHHQTGQINGGEIAHCSASSRQGRDYVFERSLIGISFEKMHGKVLGKMSVIA